MWKARSFKHSKTTSNVLVFNLSPLGDLIARHGVRYHLYIDDTQLYLTFTPTSEDTDNAQQKMEHCIDFIRAWMSQNFLKLNDDKTEILFFASRFKTHPPFCPVQIGQAIVLTSDSARDIGVILDSKVNNRPPKQLQMKSVFPIQSTAAHLQDSSYCSPAYLQVTKHAPSRRLRSGAQNLLKPPSTLTRSLMETRHLPKQHLSCGMPCRTPYVRHQMLTPQSCHN